MACPNCSVGTLEPDGAPLTFRCTACGYACFATFNPPPPQLSEHDLAEVEVVVDWPRGHPTAADVAALRKVLPTFRGRTAEDVWRAARREAVLSLGLHPRHLARDLVKEAADAGLHARIVEAA